MKPGRVSQRARVLRGLVATSACTVLAFLGHAHAGGTLPTGLTLAALALPLAALLIALADRRRGPVAIFVLLGGSQLVLHALLQALGGQHRAAMPGTAPEHSVMAHEHAHAVMAHSSPASMVGAHVLATAVTAAILAGAERVALVLALTVVDAVNVVLARRPHRFAPAIDHVVPGPVHPTPRTGRQRGVLARRLNARRGPPLPIAG
jgi:hypothetical protein